MSRTRRGLSWLCTAALALCSLAFISSARAQTAPTGACCVRTSSGGFECVVLSQADCAARNGFYRGDGTTCTDTTCTPPATGACCFPNGFCAVTTEANCTANHGTYHGNGTTCGADTCPLPTGACCLPDGTCAIRTARDCFNAHGMYRGDN